MYSFIFQILLMKQKIILVYSTDSRAVEGNKTILTSFKPG